MMNLPDYATRCDGQQCPSPDSNVESVRQKLLKRSLIGLAKYGTTLERTDLSRLDWLRHAQEEAMDLSNYLEVLIQEEEKNEHNANQPRTSQL